MHSQKCHQTRATMNRAARAATVVTIWKMGLSERPHQFHKLERFCRLWPIIALLAMAPLAACSSSSGSDNALDVQPGQIVGGATKQIEDVQPVDGFLPSPS